jgi:hypothetical protein
MREQEVFFDQQLSGKRIVILKTYDRALAHEAFDQLTSDAYQALAKSLDLNASFDPADIPSPSDSGFPDFLWGAVEEVAREDWDSFSYFIVQQIEDRRTLPLFVCPDWPRAEAYTKTMLTVPA